MESVSSTSNINAHMKNPQMNVGVIVPPDAHYKPVLYSNSLASAQFNKMEYDIYHSVKKSKDIREKKTPTSVYVALGIAALAIAFPFIKKYIK